MSSSLKALAIKDMETDFLISVLLHGSKMYLLTKLEYKCDKIITKKTKVHTN